MGVANFNSIARLGSSLSGKQGRLVCHPLRERKGRLHFLKRDPLKYS